MEKELIIKLVILIVVIAIILLLHKDIVSTVDNFLKGLPG